MEHRKDRKALTRWERGKWKGLTWGQLERLERQHVQSVVTFSHYDVLTDFVALEIASFL